MPLELLQGYERALRVMPGVIATRIVSDDGAAGKANPLRDQVIVTHLRIWDEP